MGASPRLAVSLLSWLFFEDFYEPVIEIDSSVRQRIPGNGVFITHRLLFVGDYSGGFPDRPHLRVREFREIRLIEWLGLGPEDAAHILHTSRRTGRGIPHETGTALSNFGRADFAW